MTTRPQAGSEWACRALLCAAAVAICHQLPWQWLIWATSEVQLGILGAMGFQAERLADHAIRWNDEVFTFSISCTYVDVWCGSIPWLWRGRGLTKNLQRVVAFGALVIVLNAARLVALDLIYHHGGWDWEWTDAVAGGIAYFILWRRLEHLCRIETATLTAAVGFARWAVSSWTDVRPSRPSSASP